MDPQKVVMYVCGPTVYDEPHIGHLRSAYVFDVIRKWLSKTYAVDFVRNVTDIDDKIIDRAQHEKISVHEVSQKYLNLYHADLKKMGIEDPTREPSAVHYTQSKKIEAFIHSLIHLGFAYESEGNVYFDVRKFDSYGKLSHQKIDQVMENWRTEPGEGKKDPIDFALWKKAKAHEPSWDSQWGKGRPGWHIECSVMSAHECGEEFDIHGGGRDLIFPHHENERAQSMARFKNPFVHYWIHHGLITIEGRKMSKSLDNYVTLTTLLEKEAEFGTDILKLFFLQAHYSQDVDFSWTKMEELKSSLLSIVNFLNSTSISFFENYTNVPQEAKLIQENFEAAMNDDFNTAKALGFIFEMKALGAKHIQQNKKVEAEAINSLLHAMLKDLGLLETYTSHLERKLTKEKTLFNDPSHPFMQLLTLRNQFRANKQYKASDQIRDKLLHLNIPLRDYKETTVPYFESEKQVDQVLLNPMEFKAILDEVKKSNG